LGEGRGRKTSEGREKDKREWDMTMFLGKLTPMVVSNINKKILQ